VFVRAFAGLRTCEVLALHSSRISADGHEIRVDRQLDRYSTWSPGCRLKPSWCRLATYEAAVGPDLDDAMVDGSIHKAPCGGEGTGKSPVDRGKLGWKWSIATDAVGIPIDWVAGPANRNDTTLLEATLEAVDDQGLLEEIETPHLDRGYDNGVVRRQVAEAGIAHVVVPKVRPRTGTARQAPKAVPLGRRWPVERTNSSC